MVGGNSHARNHSCALRQKHGSSKAFENTWGIRCSDEGLRSNNLTKMSPLVEDFHTESMLIGDVTWTTSMLVCAQCQLHAKERLRAHQFHGIQTKNSMLVIPNRYDPVTPVNAARNASAASPGSPIVVNEGHGVCILLLPIMLGV